MSELFEYQSCVEMKMDEHWTGLTIQIIDYYGIRIPTVISSFCKKYISVG